MRRHEMIAITNIFKTTTKKGPLNIAGWWWWGLNDHKMMLNASKHLDCTQLDTYWRFVFPQVHIKPVHDR